MTPELAETLAVQALSWLIGEDDLRDVFLGASGASEKDLRNGVLNPVFLGSLLEPELLQNRFQSGLGRARRRSKRTSSTGQGT